MSTTTTGRESRTTSGTRPVTPSGKGGVPADDAAPAEAKRKRSIKGLLKSKKFLIAVVAVLVVGGGAYKFAVPHPAPPPAGGDVVAVDPMTVNLAGGHYLKVAISVQLVKGKATAADFDTSHASELVIDEFSNRPMSSLDSDAARKKATADLLADTKKAYPGEVFDVYLTQFVMQ